MVRFFPTCMKSSFRKPDVVAAHFSCSSYVKMNRIAIDYIESLRADGKGNDMIIVIIDCFSRWVSLTAVQSKRPFVIRIMNTMVHSSTGVKPCTIVLSTEMSHETL